MKARFIREIGVRVSLRRYWGEDCPNCGGSGRPGYHNAKAKVEDVLGPVDVLHISGSNDAETATYAAERWPTRCDHCDAAAPDNATRQVFRERLYDSPSGRPEPGDLRWVRHHAPGEWCTARWTNCDGLHLHGTLPNGIDWDIDGRCSNCTLPADTTHRCWPRHGAPPDVHVDKSGHTCSAGAGSIAVPGYHGFLHHGAFTP